MFYFKINCDQCFENIMQSDPVSVENLLIVNF